MVIAKGHYISRTIAFKSREKLTGEVAIIGGAESDLAGEAVLISAHLGSGKFRAELVQRAAIFSLTFPSSKGHVAIQSQLRTVTVRYGNRERQLSFDDATRIKSLDRALRQDKTWVSGSREFFESVVATMVELETRQNLHFRLLDQVVESRDQFKQLGLRGGKKPGKAGWGGVELGCFIPCMEECEAGADWWEVWVHAECLLRCGIKCGTGGGPIFPD